MNTTRRHPRTLNEAFGPYTSNSLQPMPDKGNPWDVSTLAIAAIGVIALALAAVGWLG